MSLDRFALVAALIAVGFLAGMLILLEVGRRIGLALFERHGADSRVGVGVVDTAVYGLFALLIGFTFSGAANRFDHRRAIVSHEINAISTAWLRIDLVPPETQRTLQEDLRVYMDALLASYNRPATSVSEALLEPPALTRAGRQIWTHAVAASLEPTGVGARMLLLPTLNEMFDVVDEERLARRIHQPFIIFIMLGVSAFAAALFAGYSLACKSTNNWFFTIGVATTVSMSMYVIVELEYPRLGLIRVSEMDRALAELRATMK